MGRSRKPLWVCAHRGFKSHPFRHFNWSAFLSATAYLRVDNFNFTNSDYGWGYKSDLETQKASNNGAGLETLQFYGTESMVNAILTRLTVTTIAGITGVEIKTMTTNYKEGFIYFPKIALS